MPTLPAAPAAAKAIATNVSRHAAVYAAARPNHPALAPYETIADVLAALVDRSRLTADERDPILIAVVIEHQRTRHALWQSILLKAFAPMLLHLRKRQGRADDADLDQAVLLSFLEAARSIRAESHVARCLRIVTEAKVYEDERKARRHAGGEVFDDEVQYPSAYGASTDAKVAASGVHAREAPAARVAIADRLRRLRINALQKLSARVQRKEQTRGVASVA